MVSTLLEQVVAGHAPALHRWSVGEYHQLTVSGILPEGSSIELIDGALVCKDRRDGGGSVTNHGPRHARIVRRISQWGKLLEPFGFVLQTQLPVAISECHEPEPDAAVLRGPIQAYDERLPAPSDIVCLIEIADSSLVFDSTTKLRMYASAGVPVYWVIDSRHGQVEVHQQPDCALGRYGLRRLFRPGETIRIELGGVNFLDFAVADLIA